MVVADWLQDEETLNREIAMTEACIKKAPSNESAWNYLAGILFDVSISFSFLILPHIGLF